MSAVPTVPTESALPTLHRTSDLHRAGFDQAQIRQEMRAARLVRVRRSVYTAHRPEGDGARHRQLIEATLPVCAPGSVVSHLSAALVWGLPLIGDPPEVVELTRNDVNSGKKRGGVHLRVAGLDPSEVTMVDGIVITTLARTVVDIGRNYSFDQTVVTGDAALRNGLNRELLEASLALARKRRGIGAARRACLMLDGRSESPGESLSRVRIVRAGLPVPELQFEVRDDRGSLVARSDFGWPELRTVGEFDGKVKYLQWLRPGQTAADVVMAEKRRENAIRAVGFEVVRWDWSDFGRFDPVVAALRSAFGRAR